jgi:hypothetical protein
MIVELRPDPFDRRQVARWMLATFEVLLITGVVGSICFFVGATAATAFAAALGNDRAGQSVSALVWGPVFGFLGAWVTLRLLAR